MLRIHDEFHKLRTMITTKSQRKFPRRQFDRRKTWLIMDYIKHKHNRIVQFMFIVDC